MSALKNMLGQTVRTKLEKALARSVPVAVRSSGKIVVTVPPEVAHVVRAELRPMSLLLERTEYWGGDEVLCVMRET